MKLILITYIFFGNDLYLFCLIDGIYTIYTFFILYIIYVYMDVYYNRRTIFTLNSLKILRDQDQIINEKLHRIKLVEV